MITVLIGWFCFLMILVGGLGTPTLNISYDLHLNENDRLILSCTSNEAIEFIYPSKYLNNNTSPVKKKCKVTQNHHTVIFVRPKTVFGDTGWYGCIAERNIQEDDWIYVWIKSEKNLFVVNEDGRMIQVTFNKSLTLPCRPTSPDYHVTLTKDGQEINVGGNVEYDNKIGFIINHIQEPGNFTCTITKNNNYEKMSFIVKIIENSTHKKKLISEEKFTIEIVTILIVIMIILILVIFYFIKIHQNKFIGRQLINQKKDEMNCNLWDTEN